MATTTPLLLQLAVLEVKTCGEYSELRRLCLVTQLRGPLCQYSRNIAESTQEKVTKKVGTFSVVDCCENENACDVWILAGCWIGKGQLLRSNGGAADDDDDVVLLPTLRPCWLSAAGVAGPCGSRPWAPERQLREGSVTSRS